MDTIGMLGGIGWEAIVGLAGTLATLFGGFSMYSRMKSKTEAIKALTDSYEARLAFANEVINIKNATIKEQGGMIATLNTALDEKTARIRTLTDKEWETGRKLSASLEAYAALEKQNGDLRVLVEHYKGWHCRNSDCPNRVPPNPQLIGRKYEPPMVES